MTISTTTLKNAAFAIECDLWTDPATGANYLAKDGAILRRWEPEHDDGDAFRLMATIGFEDCIAYIEGGLEAARCYPPTDQASSIRRSILLAASEIGAALCQ
jgi:hypothetical protein